jgi:hypothetical protein
MFFLLDQKEPKACLAEGRIKSFESSTTVTLINVLLP